MTVPVIEAEALQSASVPTMWAACRGRDGLDQQLLTFALLF